MIVLRHGDDAGDVAPGVAHGHFVGLNPDFAIVFVAEGFHDAELRHAGLNDLEIVGVILGCMMRINFLGRPALDFRNRLSHRIRESLTHAEEAVAGVLEDDQRREVVEEQAQLATLAVQRLGHFFCSVPSRAVAWRTPSAARAHFQFSQR